MRSITAFLILFLFALSVSGQHRYASPNHYSFDLPPGWDSIPLRLMDKKLGDMELQNYSYEAAFQLTTVNRSNAIRYPYILVQFFPVKADMDTVPFSTLAAQTLAGFDDEIRNYHSPEVDTNKVWLVTSFAPLVDTAGHCVSRDLVIRVNNTEVVQYTKHVLFGRVGVVNVNCFMLKEKAGGEKKELDQLLTSFRFDADYAVVPLTLMTAGSHSGWGWIKLLIAIGISLGVFFMIKRFNP